MTDEVEFTASANVKRLEGFDCCIFIGNHKLF